MRRLLIVGGIVALVASSCGSEGDDGVATLENSDVDTSVTDTVASLDGPEEGTELTDEEALLEFAACMRDTGIDIEDPTVDADGNLRLGGLRGRGAGQGDGDGGGAGGGEIQAAFQACQELLGGVALGFRGQGSDQTEREDLLLAYAACMRGNGYDIPDPNFDFTGGEGGGDRRTFTGPFGEIDRDDPAFQIAQEACQDLLAGFGPGRGAGGRGGA